MAIAHSSPSLRNSAILHKVTPIPVIAWATSCRKENDLWTTTVNAAGQIMVVRFGGVRHPEPPLVRGI
jgi:hypothetical protein